MATPDKDVFTLVKGGIQSKKPIGYFHIRRSGGGGGLDLTSSLEAKFGARSSQVHQIRGKTWEVLLPQDAKVGKESQFWGHLGLYLKFKGQNLGYLSPIFLEAKCGAPTRISNANFGAKPPRPHNIEVSPLEQEEKGKRISFASFSTRSYLSSPC